MSDPTPRQPDLNTELVRRAQHGDRVAFEELAVQSRPRILAAVRGHISSNEAEDVIQDILVRAWEKLPGLRDPQAFLAWLSTLALNACRGWHRRQGRRSVSLDDAADVAANVPDPLDSVIRCELSVELREALGALPEDNRRALIMHLWGRYEYKEIAKRLGLSLSAVASRIRRAKLQMRALLGMQQTALESSSSIGGAAMGSTRKEVSRKRPVFVPQIGHTGPMSRIVMSPNGRRFVSVDNTSSLIIWDFETGRQELRITEHAYVSDMNLCFSPNGSRFALHNEAGGTVIYDLERGVRLLTLPAEGIPLAFDPSGERLWTSWWTPDPEGRDWAQTNLFCWDLASKTVARRVENLQGSRLVLSPDQTRLVTLAGKPVMDRRALLGMDNVELIVWDLSSADQVSRLSGLEGWVRVAAMSPDSRWLAASAWTHDAPNDVLIWDVGSGELLHRLREHSESVGALAFTSDASTLVAAQLDGTIICWDPQTGKEQRRLSNDSRIDDLVFTPDGTHFLTNGAAPRTVCARDWRSGEVVRHFDGHGCWTETGEFSRDGRTFAVGGYFPRVLQWDCEAGRLAAALSLPEGFWTCALTHGPAGTLATASANHDGKCQLALWEQGKPEPIRERVVDDTRVNCIALSPDGSYCAIGAYEPVVLIDVAREEAVHEFRVYEGKMMTQAVSFTPDGRGLACVAARLSDQRVTRHGAAVIWDVRTGQEIQRWEDAQGYETLAFSPDGKCVALGMAFPLPGDSRQFQMRLHDVESGALLREFALAQPKGRLMEMAFSPDGTVLAASSYNGTIFLWDPVTGELLRAIDSGRRWPMALDFSRDGRLLAMGNCDGSLLLWRMPEVMESKSPRPAVTLVALDQGTEWLAYTPQGYYDCSPGAEDYLIWRSGSEFLGPTALARRFHRPDKIRAALARPT